MDYESLTQKHLEILTETMDELMKILKDGSLTVDERLKTAKQIDSISMTVIGANLADKHGDKDDKTKNKLINQLDRLHRDHQED